MKILLSAIACDPHGSSENAVGWGAARLLAQEHDVWVITHPICQPGLERARSEGIVPERLRVIVHGRAFKWHENRQIARLQSWMEYLRWTRTLLDRAAAEHANVGFDLSHHVTYSSWRVASPLWKMSIPLVWGPVGGASRFPLKLLPWLSKKSAAFEIAREAAHLAGKQSRAVRECCQNAAAVIGSNREASRLLMELRGTGEGVHTIYPVLFTPETIERFALAAGETKPAGPIQIFSGGFVIGTKGLAFALHALGRLHQSGVQFHYTIAGAGPEISHLQRLTNDLGIESCVSFGEGFSGPAYAAELKRAHIILQPSFRENVGITMLEGMLAGAVPIVLATSAPGEIVSSEVGFPIPVGSGEEIVQRLAQAIETVNTNRILAEELGRAAAQKVRREFSEQIYLEQINSVYHSVLRERTGSSSK